MVNHRQTIRRRQLKGLRNLINLEVMMMGIIYWGD